ncbi:hypothetical protein NQ318_008382 [Aromia moschata]|uniref:DUF4817 domain-containing protein n=1 Tax=Aromia moschata TaxID=1265417 RepID=A0AAV8YI29_9CUCU|nr:hypothetical protein NQ318_008382 [Aromia moschata]
MHKITILQIIGYGDRTRTQAEVVRLFQEKYPELSPISQGTRVAAALNSNISTKVPLVKMRDNGDESELRREVIDMKVTIST